MNVSSIWAKNNSLLHHIDAVVHSIQRLLRLQSFVDVWVGSMFLWKANEWSRRCWGIFCSFKLRSSGVFNFIVRECNCVICAADYGKAYVYRKDDVLRKKICELMWNSASNISVTANANPMFLKTMSFISIFYLRECRYPQKILHRGPKIAKTTTAFLILFYQHAIHVLAPLCFVSDISWFSVTKMHE